MGPYVVYYKAGVWLVRILYQPILSNSSLSRLSGLRWQFWPAVVQIAVLFKFWIFFSFYFSFSFIFILKFQFRFSYLKLFSFSFMFHF